MSVPISFETLPAEKFPITMMFSRPGTGEYVDSISILKPGFVRLPVFRELVDIRMVFGDGTRRAISGIHLRPDIPDELQPVIDAAVEAHKQWFLAHRGNDTNVEHASHEQWVMATVTGMLAAGGMLLPGPALHTWAKQDVTELCRELLGKSSPEVPDV